MQEIGTQYERAGAWWNRRGDEIDLLALGLEGDLAVEIKNRDLTLSRARSVLSALEKKVPLVKGRSGPVTLGIAARTIQRKEKLREEGFCICDLADLGFVQ